MTLNATDFARAFSVTPGAQQMQMAWGIVQSNNTDGTANVRLGGSTTTLVIPYATPYPARPGSKVGVIANGADVAITHIIAPSAIPSCRISRRAGAQSFTSATAAAVVFDFAEFDPWALWNGGDSIVIPVAGLYSIAGGFNFAANATGVRSGYFTLSGNFVNYQRENGPDGSNTVNQTMAATIPCVAGDVVKLNAVQNSGGALNMNAATAYDAWMSVVWLGWQGPTPVYGPELQDNPSAETLSVSPHSSFWGTFQSPTVTTTVGEYAYGTAGFKNVFSGSGTWVFQGNTVAVKPGDVYRFSYAVKSSIATTGAGVTSGTYVEVLTSGVKDVLEYFDPDVLSTTIMPVAATSNVFAVRTVEWTVPDGVYWMRPSWRCAHTAALTFYLDACSVTQKDLS